MRPQVIIEIFMDIINWQRPEHHVQCENSFSKEKMIMILTTSKPVQDCTSKNSVKQSPDINMSNFLVVINGTEFSYTAMSRLCFAGTTLLFCGCKHVDMTSYSYSKEDIIFLRRQFQFRKVSSDTHTYLSCVTRQ